MKSRPFPECMAKSFILGLFCCTALSLTGCGGTGSQDGPTASTADCATTTADALVSVDSDDTDSLLASAITSDCDEVAVYEDNGTVSQAAVLLADGSTVVAEFNGKGDVVAVRSGEDTLTLSYNDGLGFARSEFTTAGGDPTASVFSVSRDDGTATKRSSAQNGGENAAFCDELKQFGGVIEAACQADPSQPYCGGAIQRAGQAAAKLCTDNIEELGALEGTVLGNDKQDFPLGVDGFVTARSASNDGTTFICAAEAFGGQPPFDIDWTVSSTPDDGTAPISQLPGGAAVVDATTNTGQYGFLVTVTDANGDQAVDEIPFNLGDEGFFGAKIVASDEDPDVDEEVTFKAIIQDFQSDATVATEEPAAGTIYWDLGDGTTATGEVVTHSYTEAGVYDVYLMVIAQVECDFSDLITIVVGGGGDEEEVGFSIEIVASADSMVPGDVITLSPVVAGAIEPLDYGWDIINEDGRAIADIFEAGTSLSAQSVFTETVGVEAFEEGIVQVGLLAVDATGRVAIATRSIPVFGDEGGLFVVIEGPFELEAGVAGVLKPFVVGGRGGLSYDWYIEDDPFSAADDLATLSDPRAANPEIVVNEPGFVGVGLTVTDQAGNQAYAFNGIAVFAEGFDDLFVEFLGPFEVPVGEVAPLYSFIVGGEEPYFCSWDVFTSASGAVIEDPFNCFDTAIKFFEPGCVDLELVVEDIKGALGFVVFTVCAGAEFLFDCPYDDLCDPDCAGFDPDCEDPCPFDGFCDEFCPIGDPDCFDEFDYCLPDDGFCDHFCADFGSADPDCDHCGKDDVCVFFCPDGEDPDCNREFCMAGDGYCDFGCFPEDPDCADMHCRPDDGYCDFPCDVPDPDCGMNADLCAEFYYCCEGDGYCDMYECPEPDLDCNNCGEDGVCVYDCEVPDPDCGEFADCLDDFECDDLDPCTFDYCDFGTCFYEFDPQCGGAGDCVHDFDCDDFDPCTFDYCAADGLCVHDKDPACSADCIDDSYCDDFDPCTVDSCGADGLCNHDTDPLCTPGEPCGDGVCDTQAGEDATSCPADCDLTGFCGDGICDAQLNESGVTCPLDCLAGGVCGDGVCDPGLGEDISTCPGDCSLGGFCGDGTCDPGTDEDCITCGLDCGPC